MIIGKQSTLNDLQQFYTEMEAKVQDAKNINLDMAAQIEGAKIQSGAMMDYRPNGIYHFDMGVSDSSAFGITEDSFSTNGCGVYMQPSDGNQDFAVMLFANWAGHAYVGAKRNGIFLGASRILTSLNTIVDANGFIKTA